MAHMVPESEIMQHLLDIDAGVERLIKRRKQEMYDTLALPDHDRKVLRLYIYNTHSNQPPAGKTAPAAQAAAPNGNGTAAVAAAAAEPPATNGSKASEPADASDPRQDPPSWTLTVFAKLQEPNADAAAAAAAANPMLPAPTAAQQQHPQYPRALTTFVERVEVT